MKKKKNTKFTAVLASIFATFAVYTGALAIFLYVQGWRFDFTDQSIKQVGVLTVESSPSSADIYVNDVHKGRSNKSMTLDVGKYDLIVSKDGYHDWNKEVKILEEKSTPVYPYLVLTEFEFENIFKSDLLLLKHWEDNSNNHLVFLLQDETAFKLFHYDINTGFWTINNAPIEILSIPINTEDLPVTDVELLLSPSGEKAVMTVITAESSNKYVIPTDTPSEYTEIIKSPLALEGFSNYEIKWSYDEEYLVLESEADVISYNITRDTKNLLYRKVDELDVWSTNRNGFFYLFDHIETSEEGVSEYTLKEYNMDGSSENVVVPSVFLQNNTEYLDNYRSSNFDFGFFTNSPENTQTIGEIIGFTVFREVNGIFIKTTQASYWYDSTIGKYITVSPFPSEIIELSPDQDKLLIKTPTEYKMFVFDKEDGDHTITIGTHDISNLDMDLVSNINWLSNSNYIQYEEDNSIYVADQDGENKTPLLSNENILYWTVTRSRENLIILNNTEEEGLQITNYTIH
jgi:hypothetical protein